MVPAWRKQQLSLLIRRTAPVAKSDFRPNDSTLRTVLWCAPRVLLLVHEKGVRYV
jgi:hypothetical protein